ncbi:MULTISPECIES: signal peptidase I [unclassified Neptuniibacter]|uniref:signal peptidase I n=1 Tax=unclassified Neptuniibacter TaxID=2630693 RepID=UPI0025EB6A12|nr:MULTISPECIES: signal peptidase I [unclassified Neptuniibacter]|tara:strand:+ start:8069 stop:8881 length:813 start_codon:yes stop_codon:yes gene_type:complete
MDFDFALILVALTFVSGLVWFYDKISLKPKRTEKLNDARAKVEGELPEEVLTEINRESGWVDTGRSMFPVLLVVLVLRSFLVEPFQIPSGSMLPTLKIGDFILVNKFHYGLRLPVLNTKIVSMNDPERGDVIVFKFPEKPTINYIKRVVGLPGDVIRYQGKTLYINGEPQKQTLLAQLPPSNPKQLLMSEDLDGVQHQIYKDVIRPAQNMEWVVPKGHYFMVGDNRDNSNDSRYWGFVSEDLLVGKAFAVWMHWPAFLSVPSFSDVRVIE